MVKIIDRLIGRQIRKPTGLIGQALGHLMANEHKTLVDWMLQYMPVQPHFRVLDVGCGGGMAVKTIAGLATNGHVVGIDYSLSMVGQAARRNSMERRQHRVSILAGNVAALPFADESFDLACGVETIYFWPDPLLGLKEIGRTLKPGAMVGLVVDISKEATNSEEVEDVGRRMSFNVFSGIELKSLLEEAGFVRPSFQAASGRGKGWLFAGGFKD